MTIPVHFYSYFKELTCCEDTVVVLEAGATIGQLIQQLHLRFPKLVTMQNSTLIAVGVDYQDRNYELKEGDVVSLFPPVQGG